MDDLNNALESSITFFINYYEINEIEASIILIVV